MYKRLHVSGIAPAKRGVPVLLHVFAVEIISIHAPVWGRAPLHRRHSHIRGYFNSRPRVGAGPEHGDDERQQQAISIHAPVWGRALSSALASDIIITFQFTPPCGGGVDRYNTLSNNLQFQFTPPCGGGSPVSSVIVTPSSVFQFTPPCGGGPSTVSVCASMMVSFQFTPPCGGGRGDLAAVQRRLISIHAPVWGRASKEERVNVVCYDFNSRPRVGAGMI